MIRYKINVLDALNDHGYSTYRLTKEKTFGQATMQAFRTGRIVTAVNLDRLCKLLNMQPGDIIEYIPDDEVI